jgi:alpha-tubulin suppressor-like RCC1 family protein
MKKLFFLLIITVLQNNLTNAQCWVDVVAGEQHTLAIKSDGTLWAWGSNSYGQLGDGSQSDKAVPVQIGSDKDWKAVLGGGEQSSMAQKKDGTLWAWGDSNTKQLGLVSGSSSTTPALCNSNLTKIKTAQFGTTHTAAISEDGNLWLWGNNSYGQLGVSKMEAEKPKQLGTSEWSSCSAGFIHNVAIKKDSTLWAWGGNVMNEVGDGTMTQQDIPVLINKEKCWIFADAGLHHNLAIKKDGTLWAWGANANGQLGNKNTAQKSKPVKIGKDTDWVSVEAGFDVSFGIKKDGSLWSWGANYAGFLGNGGKENGLVPTKIAAEKKFIKVSSMDVHVVALDTENNIWSWGKNDHGQLGNNSDKTSLLPVKVSCQ